MTMTMTTTTTTIRVLRADAWSTRLQADGNDAVDVSWEVLREAAYQGDPALRYPYAQAYFWSLVMRARLSIEGVRSQSERWRQVSRSVDGALEEIAAWVRRESELVEPDYTHDMAAIGCSPAQIERERQRRARALRRNFAVSNQPIRALRESRLHEERAYEAWSIGDDAGATTERRLARAATGAL